MHNTIRSFAVAAALAAGSAHAGQAFAVHSADIADHGNLKAAQVYQGFGCHGGNQSPQLTWSGEPAGTKSFAVTVYDPDAPTGSGWWHWMAYDIPASVHTLESGAGRPDGMPHGARQARNDFGSHDFGGACPPSGDKPHRYIVTVHALKIDHIAAPADASPAMIGFMLHANDLATASLTGRYGRK